MTTSFTPNDPFDRLFLLKGIEERRTKTGKPFLVMTLGTPEGVWEGRIWDMGMNSLPGLVEGDPVRARGTAQLYQDKIQLIVDEISKVDGHTDFRELYPASSVPESQLRREFMEFVDGVADPSLRALLEVMLGDRTISDGFFVSPAAITMHHARIGGLAEHSLNVCRLAHAAFSAAPWLDRDLLTAGALLHDIGKVLEYEVAGDFRYTLEGRYLGHIVQGHSQVETWIKQVGEFPEQRGLDVLHIILSHHGQMEYGSPMLPITAEALVIHFADDLDAKLDMVRTAGKDQGTEEAFVRGLRRTFQYRKEQQDAGRRTQHTEEPEMRKQRNGETEKAGTESEAHRGKESPNHGPTESRTHGGTGKSGGQEELF